MCHAKLKIAHLLTQISISCETMEESDKSGHGIAVFIIWSDSNIVHCMYVYIYIYILYYIYMSPPLILSPLVNMSKGGCENKFTNF